MSIVVNNQSGATISVFVSKYSNDKGSDDWFTVPSGGQETWERTNWELVAIRFQDNDRQGVYVHPSKLITIFGKGSIDVE